MADDHMPDIGQLVQIPRLLELNQSGVYFLHYEGEVVYVGQAVNVRKRLGQHITDGTKAFDAVSFIPCEVAKLSRVEATYIKRLLPKYNQCLLATAAKANERTFGSSTPIDTDRAAKVLGITSEALLGLNDKGPAFTTKLVGRSRKRERFYNPDALHEYAARIAAPPTTHH